MIPPTKKMDIKTNRTS